MHNNDQVRRYLKTHGLKLTGVRAAIMESAEGCEGHFDADGLYDAARKRGSKVSRATVYRTLPLLVEAGLLRETLGTGDKTRYEHALGHAHHDHLECISCGKIVEFKVDEIEALQDALCRKSGFTAVDHQLTIRGYCASCARKAKNRA